MNAASTALLAAVAAAFVFAAPAVVAQSPAATADKAQTKTDQSVPQGEDKQNAAGEKAPKRESRDYRDRDYDPGRRHKGRW